jgi:UDP-2-acetamido-3-amino-2,3-dideoxy-glucuronate N-acetyltransferase
MGLGALAAVCDLSASARADLSATYPDVRWSGEVGDLLKDSEVTGVAIAMPAKTHGALVFPPAGKGRFRREAVLPRHRRRQALVLAVRRPSAHVRTPVVMPPAVLKLRELVHAGEFGGIHYTSSKRLRDHRETQSD